jgi:hypothetical protein
MPLSPASGARSPGPASDANGQLDPLDAAAPHDEQLDTTARYWRGPFAPSRLP